MRIAIKRHILLTLFRLVLAIGVVCAFPFGAYHSVYYSTGGWVNAPVKEGQELLGIIVAPILVGALLSAAFMGFSSLGQFLLRRRFSCFTVFSDLALFFVFAYLPLIGGVRMMQL